MKKLFVPILVLTCSLATAKPQKLPTLEQTTLVYDVSAGRNLQAHNETAVVSIASMTKLVTTLAVLEAGQSLNEMVAVRGVEKSPRIRRGLEVSRRDLIELTMVSSDNLAARSLIESYPGGYVQGIQAMNDLVQRLGAVNTVLVEPTGLMAANKSTAEDIVRIIRATTKYPMFATFANQKHSEVRVERVSRTQRVIQWVTGITTNPFFHEAKPFKIDAFKTGFTSAAGWCLTMLVTYNDRQYVLVTAGNPTKQARKMQADKLIEQITNQQYRIDIVDTHEP